MRSRSLKLLLLAATAAALAAGPAAAAALGTVVGPGTSATPTSTTATTPTTATTATTATTNSDRTSDRSALSDYRAYLLALVDGAPAGGRAAALFAASVNERCSRVLGPIASLSSSRVSSAALSDLGQEIGADLALEFLSEADQPFTQLSSSLTGLAWAEPAPAQAIHQLLSTEGAVLALSPSGLCADARELATRPGRVPPGSVAFLSVYASDSAALKQQFNEFLAVLSRYATANDNNLIGEVNYLVARFGAVEARYEHRDASAILASLGLSS